MKARTAPSKHRHCNHHHELTPEQKVVDFGTGKFVADKARIPLLKALNECGLKTRTHCYGHKTGHSFVAILLDDDVQIEVRKVNENVSGRRFPEGAKELLISWKRND